MKDDEIKSKTDEEIVEIVRSSNKELFAHIVRRYQDKLTRYAMYLIGDYDEASDTVQQAFIKSYINLNSFDLKKNFSSWIYRIVHNEAINLIKKNKRTINIDSNIDFGSGESIEEEYIKKELVSNTHECLKKIDLIYKEPLSLYYLENKSYKDISDILRIPIGTVSVRISRAKIILKKICKQKIKTI